MEPEEVMRLPRRRIRKRITNYWFLGLFILFLLGVVLALSQPLLAENPHRHSLIEIKLAGEIDFEQIAEVLNGVNLPFDPKMCVWDQSFTSCSVPFLVVPPSEMLPEVLDRIRLGLKAWGAKDVSVEVVWDGSETSALNSEFPFLTVTETWPDHRWPSDITLYEGRVGRASSEAEYVVYLDSGGKRLSFIDPEEGVEVGFILRAECGQLRYLYALTVLSMNGEVWILIGNWNPFVITGCGSDSVLIYQMVEGVPELIETHYYRGLAPTGMTVVDDEIIVLTSSFANGSLRLTVINPSDFSIRRFVELQMEVPMLLLGLTDCGNAHLCSFFASGGGLPGYEDALVTINMQTGEVTKIAFVPLIEEMAEGCPTPVISGDRIYPSGAARVKEIDQIVERDGQFYRIIKVLMSDQGSCTVNQTGEVLIPIGDFTETETPTATPSFTSSPSPTSTPTPTMTETSTPTSTQTATPTASVTVTLTPTVTPTATPTETATPTLVFTPSSTPSPTSEPTTFVLNLPLMIKMTSLP